MPVIATVTKGSGTKKYRVKWVKLDRAGYTIARGTVQFGARGYDDYTTHKDKKRRRRYLVRHGAVIPKSKENDLDYQPTRSRKENWTANGYDTAGFWSRWLLWSEPTLSTSARLINTRFGISVKMDL